MKKVIFVASSGGHLSELLNLRSIFDEYDYLLVTEKTELTEKLKSSYKIDYLIYGPNKNKFKYITNILSNIFMCIRILFKFKPETIISTGAQVGGIMCFLGKLFKCKIIYIESLAKTKSLSITGKNVYKFADKFYVQWESLASIYDKAEYLGRMM